MLKFFELGEKNTLRIAKDEVLLHPEFAFIYRKSKGVDGDADGRKKLYAYSVFTYIYLMYDYNSSFADLDDKRRHKDSVKESNLPETWTPNAAEQDAIDRYIKLQDDKTPTLKVVANLKRGLTMSADVVKFQTDRMEHIKAAILQMGDTLDYTNTESLSVYNSLVETLTKSLTSFLPLADKINLTLDSVVKLESKVIVEMGKDKEAAGGKSIGNRADPK